MIATPASVQPLEEFTCLTNPVSFGSGVISVRERETEREAQERVGEYKKQKNNINLYYIVT